MKISDLKTYNVVNPRTQATSSTQSKSVGQKILDVGTGVSNFFGAQGMTEQFGADIARTLAPKEQKDFVEYPSVKKVVGSAIQTGANLLPGAGKGFGLLGKSIVGAGTGYTFDVGSKIQADKSAGEVATPGVGTIVGGALPSVGAGLGYANRVMGRLFKGLGSGISGVPTRQLDEMLNNPEVAQKATDKLSQSGNYKVIEENAKQIINGVSAIKKEARQEFGNAVQLLKKEDINPTTFRQSLQPILDKFGSTQNGKFRTLQNVEFDKPVLIKKASNLIDDLSTTNLDGFSIRKLMNKIDNTKFKTVGSDAERQSFNAFLKELSDGVKNSIVNSTDKLGQINAKFTSDMQLAEATEKIFGKVKFKNISETSKAAKGLEGLFNQKGLDPKITDDFLKRIGVTPSEFKTSEAVRQVTNKEPMPSNTPGFSVGEILRTTTSSIITPETVRNITIKTGLAKNQLTPFLEGLKTLSPALQKILIQSLLESPQQEAQQSHQR